MMMTMMMLMMMMLIMMIQCFRVSISGQGCGIWHLRAWVVQGVGFGGGAFRGLVPASGGYSANFEVCCPLGVGANECRDL